MVCVCPLLSDLRMDVSSVYFPLTRGCRIDFPTHWLMELLMTGHEHSAQHADKGRFFLKRDGGGEKDRERG